MTDRRNRRTHTCPECGHIFKKFKWSRCWTYDGPCAKCPHCGTPGHEWAKIEAEKNKRKQELLKQCESIE